jgi:hypothetical protein
MLNEASVSIRCTHPVTGNRERTCSLFPAAGLNVGSTLQSPDHPITGSPDSIEHPATLERKSGVDPSNPAARCCIQSGVTGLGLIKRVFLVVLVAAGLLTFLGATSHASPIRPDVRKLLSQPPIQMPQYVPARAGWNGPEISTARTAPNPTLESLSPAATQREVRSTLMAMMMPDLRILALLALVILLLRRIRKHPRVPAASVAVAHGATGALPARIPPASVESQSEPGEARPAA